MSRGTIKLLGEMVNSFVFYIFIFISSDFDQKSSANKRVYDMTKDYKKELEMHLDYSFSVSFILSLQLCRYIVFCTSISAPP